MTEKADTTENADTTGKSDEVMEKIVAAIKLSHDGERDEAREHFAALWDEIGPDGDPFHRCTLAHYMADVQDDPNDELTWDLRALEAAEALTDERAQSYHASLTVEGFLPSLHLNLADDYNKLSDFTRAREHLERARETVHVLADDVYGAMIRSGIDRVTGELDKAGF
jgi:hypothetical protein